MTIASSPMAYSVVVYKPSKAQGSSPHSTAELSRIQAREQKAQRRRTAAIAQLKQETAW